MTALLEGFPFSASADARILILGSMPGVESLKQQQYYAHPRNAFWDIMGEFFGAHRQLAYPQRLQQLVSHRVALWDVAKHCVRPGSLDSSIRHDTVVANDFAALFAVCPHITQVFFNGAKAAELFRRLVIKNAQLQLPDIETHQLPSTSPANARMTLEQKVRAWEIVREIARAQ